MNIRNGWIPMAIACCFRLRSKSDKHIVHFEIVVTYNMLTFMANYVGKAGDLRYNDPIC